MNRVNELVGKAKTIVAGNPDRGSMWRAYVALEYAIMDLKLRYNLEGQSPPAKPSRKAIDILEVRSLLARLDLSSDQKKLMYDLRTCRDTVKALLASYDRRSTKS